MIKTQQTTDKFAITLSLVCVVHCFFFPAFVIFTSGFISLSIDNEFVHKLLIFTAVPLSIFALTLGYKNHQSIKSEDIIKKTELNNKIIGIGESGLDFYYNHSDKKDQIKCFEEHIAAAQNTQLPLIVHTRNAETETLEILKNKLSKKNFKILIHCFTGSKEFAFKLLDLGAYISASGVVTFKKSEDLANTFKEISNDRILVETDSPYLAPVPLRGKPNEPSYIVHTVKFLSKLKNLSFEDFSNITTKNFFNLFGELN